MNQAIATQRAVLHLSITGENRRLDLGVPAQVPLVELLPGIIRELGVLDPSMVHGGFSLRKADGSELDPAATCSAQGVKDGELLTLVRGGLITERRRYDDVVEAVIDAGRDRHSTWTPTDHARTALGVALTLLAIGAGLLLTSSRGLTLSAIIALGAALVLVATGAVLTRVGRAETGHGLGLAAAVYGAVGAYLLTPAGTPWAWPMAAAGLGLLIVGGAALAASNNAPQVHFIPILTGAAIGITSVVAALTGPGSIASYAVMAAVLGSISNVLPWLALSSTRIKVISPQSDADMLADPPPIDGDDVARRAGAGHRLLLAIRIAFAVSVLVVTPLIASQGVAGALLTTGVFVGMMFESRQVYARSEVATLMGMGTLGLALTGTVVALTGAISQAVLLVILIVAAILLVTITMFGSGSQIRLIKLYDTAELICLTALLPLGAITAGLA